MSSYYIKNMYSIKMDVLHTEVLFPVTYSIKNDKKALTSHSYTVQKH